MDFYGGLAEDLGVGLCSGRCLALGFGGEEIGCALQVGGVSKHALVAFELGPRALLDTRWLWSGCQIFCFGWGSWLWFLIKSCAKGGVSALSSILACNVVEGGFWKIGRLEA